jgi:kynurenine formamidase
MLPDDLAAIAERVSTWGRWGDDDQRGTLNLIDAAAVLRGVAAVKTGDAFSLAIPFDQTGPQTGMIPGRENPSREMIAVNMEYEGPGGVIVNDDKVDLGVQSCTHWDSLAHTGYDDRLYGGRDAAATVTSDEGCRELGIEAFGPVVTRGLVFDFARHRGVETFDDPRGVGATELDEMAAAMEMAPVPGDVVLLRTGNQHWLRAGDQGRYADPSPGFDTTSVEWLADHGVAAAASDTLVFEQFPPERGDTVFPVHQLNLRDRGMPQGQNFHLDELAAACAVDARYDVLLCATPVPTTGTAGGIVAPTAIR